MTVETREEFEKRLRTLQGKLSEPWKSLSRQEFELLRSFAMELGLPESSYLVPTPTFCKVQGGAHLKTLRLVHRGKRQTCPHSVLSVLWAEWMRGESTDGLHEMAGAWLRGECDV